ncbi:MAG: AraC family transcriptional regulator [Pseudomonadota bacterium]
MALRYKDIYPSPPMLDSDGAVRPSASALMSLQYFQAEPDTMPEEVFVEHHILLNLKEAPQRVINLRDGERRDFTFRRNDIVVTPAGIRSGWRWFERSDVIVVTMEPEPVARFAETELGLLLTDRQLADTPVFSDADIVAAGTMLRDSLQSDAVTSAVMFEAMARVFLVKLLQKYSERRPEDVALSARFTSAHHRRVLAYVGQNLERTIAVEDLAREVGMSTSHFSRVFKEVMGRTPMQFVMVYRIEQAMKMMTDAARPLGEIAIACGFADQAHFSRSFKQVVGKTPRAHRAELTQAP